MTSNLRLPALAALISSLVVLGPATAAAPDPVAMPGDPVPVPFPAPSRTGEPLENLPPDIHIVSYFGERPAYSPDGSRIAFVGKSYGDVYEYDLKTGKVRNLTAHVPNSGFLRVHFLRDGSYLLLGPRTMAATAAETRISNIELWWMGASGEGQIFPLGQKVYEGIAVSARSNLIAWTVMEPNVGKRPYGLDAKMTIWLGDVEVKDGKPELVNRRALVRTNWDDCQIEAQDFYDNDRKLTATCYVFNKSRAPGQRLVTRGWVYSVDIPGGALTRIPTPDSLYAEIEGIFPDRRRSMVECGNDSFEGIDLCLLELKTDSPRYTRLTHVTDFGAYRFSNPVVSPDGRHVAFQLGIATEEAGRGHGILVMDLAPGS